MAKWLGNYSSSNETGVQTSTGSILQGGYVLIVSPSLGKQSYHAGKYLKMIPDLMNEIRQRKLFRSYCSYANMQSQLIITEVLSALPLIMSNYGLSLGNYN